MFQEKTIDALKWIVGILNKKNIPYQISGGFSAKLYGSNRPLNDIDIDIPEKNFEDILDEVKPFIEYGPGRENDGKWDLCVMKLNFKDQIIDIGGAYETKISNKERTAWIACPVDFSKVKLMEVEGLSVNVMSPEDLIDYKQYLDGDHQVEDIEAVKKYLYSQ